MALQSWCYRKFSLQEVIGKAAGAGVKYLELSPVHADLARLDTAQAREIRRRLLDAGLSVQTYGVVDLAGKGRGKPEDLFRRAQEFGLRTVLIEAGRGRMKELDRLAGRYRVNVAVHNRSESPEQVREAIRDCSPRCGAAVDTGNYLSAGYDAAAAIEKLQARVLSVHLKDVARPGVSCPLGQGRADVPAILKALRAQQYDRIVAVEYEETPESPDAAIAASLEYLKKVTGGR